MQRRATFAILLFELIGLILAVGGALSVILLSLGWSFAWHWFASWDVPFASVQFGADNLLEYGRIVIIQLWWLALLWLFGTGVLVWMVYRNLTSTDVRLALVLAIAFLVPWLFSHQLGALAAKAEIRQVQLEAFASWPEVHLVLPKGIAEALPASIARYLTKGPDLCYRLLFRGRDGLWLVRMGYSGYPEASIFIPNDAVLYLRLRRPQGADC